MRGDLLLKIAPDLPHLAQQAGVDIVAGPFVNREHTVVVVVRSDTAENVDRFLTEARLPQWNSVRVLPSLTIAGTALRNGGAVPQLPRPPAVHRLPRVRAF